MIRILITGSRNWTDKKKVLYALVDQVMYKKEDVVFIHGGCPTGADAIAGEWIDVMGVKTEVYPADWDKHGRAAGPIRNQQMVDLGADVCLAFPLGESRGTRHCMKAAEKAGIKVINYGD